VAVQFNGVVSELPAPSFRLRPLDLAVRIHPLTFGDMERNGRRPMSSLRWLRNSFALGLMVLTWSSMGCGKPQGGDVQTALQRDVYPHWLNVAGTLTWQDGTAAKELEGALVEIETSNITPPSGGPLKADGTFGPIGVPPGTHRVQITPKQGAQSPLAPRFQSFDTSGLTYTAWGSRKEIVRKDIILKVEKQAE